MVEGKGKIFPVELLIGYLCPRFVAAPTISGVDNGVAVIFIVFVAADRITELAPSVAVPLTPARDGSVNAIF